MNLLNGGLQNGEMAEKMDGSTSYASLQEFAVALSKRMTQTSVALIAVQVMVFIAVLLIAAQI